MSMTIQTLGGLLFVAMTGCAALDRGAYMDPRVAAQVTVSKNEPPPGCAYVGAVKGKSYLGDLSDAHGDVLRNAVLRGQPVDERRVWGMAVVAGEHQKRGARPLAKVADLASAHGYGLCRHPIILRP